VFSEAAASRDGGAAGAGEIVAQRWRQTKAANTRAVPARRDRDAARIAALANCQKGNAGNCTLRLTACNQ
jgi:hypothetical protein